MAIRTTRIGAVAATLALCVVGAATAPAEATPSARHFANCTALNKVYKHGVGRVGARDHVSGHAKPVTNYTRSNALYAANQRSDRDGDRIACEKH